MDRVFESGAAVAAPAAPASPSNGYATAGNPATATPATKPGPYWYHMITESLRKLIVDAGLTPDHTNLNLISQAVQAMISAGAANDYKASARAATVGSNITLAGGAPNTLDGVTLVANDRILVKDQTTASQNGVYYVTTLGTGANGTWTRTTDADQAGELTSGAIIAIEEGTINADSQWMLTTDGIITIGTTSLTFTRKDVSASSVSTPPAIPQTVLSGPVDSNGYSAFGGAVGGATLTASGTLVATCGAGGTSHRTGSITNPAWTAPAGSGTGFLMLAIDATGVVTTSVRTLQPAYQWGGIYSVTNGQFTYNIQENTGKAGNGASAAQVYEVCVGECPYTAGAWSGTIVWYAIKGRYEGAFVNTLPGVTTVVSLNHNIGVSPDVTRLEIKCLTADLGYSVGDIIDTQSTSYTASAYVPFTTVKTAKTCGFTCGQAVAFAAVNKGSGNYGTLTSANWAYRMTAYRGW